LGSGERGMAEMIYLLFIPALKISREEEKGENKG